MLGTLSIIAALTLTAPAKAPAKKGGPDPALAEVGIAKRAFRTAVEMCATPAGRCELGSRTLDREYLTLLEDTEKHFVEACRVCATEEKCETERQRIRDGKRSPGAAPCQP